MAARTLYELIMTNGERRILLAYCSNRSRRTILDICRKHVERLKIITGSDDFTFAPVAMNGATLAGGWEVKWSGRTQLEAKTNPHAWIGIIRTVERIGGTLGDIAILDCRHVISFDLDEPLRVGNLRACFQCAGAAKREAA